MIGSAGDIFRWSVGILMAARVVLGLSSLHAGCNWLNLLNDGRFLALELAKGTLNVPAQLVLEEDLVELPELEPRT